MTVKNRVHLHRSLGHRHRRSVVLVDDVRTRGVSSPPYHLYTPACRLVCKISTGYSGRSTTKPVNTQHGAPAAQNLEKRNERDPRIFKHGFQLPCCGIDAFAWVLVEGVLYGRDWLPTNVRKTLFIVWIRHTRTTVRHGREMGIHRIRSR